MTQTRFSLALDQGALTLSDGTVCVWNAPADMALDFAPLDQLHMIQTFAPAHDTYAARGVSVATAATGAYDTALVFCQRARAATFAALFDALACTPPGALIAVTFPGAFSADGIDKGSALLAQHLPALAGKVADLGAGWGYLSGKVLGSDKVTSLDMIEADHNALDAAKLNITDPRAVMHWADMARFQGGPYDAIISLLAPKGQFWMVANRNLPYEQTLDTLFSQVDTIAQTGGFKVIRARRPKPAQKARAAR